MGRFSAMLDDHPRVASTPREQITDRDANCAGNEQWREWPLFDLTRNGAGDPLTTSIRLLAHLLGMRPYASGGFFDTLTRIPSHALCLIKNGRCASDCRARAVLNSRRSLAGSLLCFVLKCLGCHGLLSGRSYTVNATRRYHWRSAGIDLVDFGGDHYASLAWCSWPTGELAAAE
jgi:hypothetical protein